MIYRLLGQLEIREEGGRSLPLPGGHTLIVLAVLLISANQCISKSELLQAAWSSEQVSDAQLHKSITAVRALLNQVGHGGDVVTYHRQGYKIQASDDDLDMLAFRRLVRQAGEARSAGRFGEEARYLREALRLWRGRHPMSNVPSSAFQQEAGQLAQRRKRAAVRLYDLELARQNYDGVLDDLALTADCYPADERLCGQVMVAQYRCGHVTDATAAYERYATALTEQTCGAPDPALRALYYAIANRDEATIAVTESGIARRAGISAAAAAAAAIPQQPRPDPAGLFGRDHLGAEASWLLCRLPGGRR